MNFNYNFKTKKKNQEGSVFKFNDESITWKCKESNLFNVYQVLNDSARMLIENIEKVTNDVIMLLSQPMWAIWDWPFSYGFYNLMKFWQLKQKSQQFKLDNDRSSKQLRYVKNFLNMLWSFRKFPFHQIILLLPLSSPPPSPFPQFFDSNSHRNRSKLTKQCSCCCFSFCYLHVWSVKVVTFIVLISTCPVDLNNIT